MSHHDFQFSVVGLADQVWADGKHVHARALEAIDGFAWGTDDRFIFIEAGVQDDGDSSLALESPNQIIIEWIFVPAYALQPSGIVDMIYSAKLSALFWTNLVNVEHEWRRMIMVEIFALAFGKD